MLTTAARNEERDETEGVGTRVCITRDVNAVEKVARLPTAWITSSTLARIQTFSVD